MKKLFALVALCGLGLSAIGCGETKVEGTKETTVVEKKVETTTTPPDAHGTPAATPPADGTTPAPVEPAKAP